MRCPHCQSENPQNAVTCQACQRGLSNSSPPTGALSLQTVLQDRYIIQRRIGQGGMGAVYMASDRRLGTVTWAVKEMSASALTSDEARRQARDAFRQEAELLAGLNHPNLPRVVDHFSQDGKEYLVMEFVPGQTLAQVMTAEPPPWSVDRALEFAEQIGEVLEYLHAQQPPIIFRDLKPANVIRTPKGTLKLVDFGIARLFKPGQAHDTQAFGTVGYAAPEQYGHGQTDARSDIYSLGVLLHQLLSNHNPALTPFNLPFLTRLNPAVPEPLANLVSVAIHADPGQRFQTVGALRTALRSLPKAAYIAPAQGLPHAAYPASYQQPGYQPATPQSGLPYPPATPHGRLPYPPATPQSGLPYPPATPQSGLPYPPLTPQSGLPYPAYGVTPASQETTGLAKTSRTTGIIALSSMLLGLFATLVAPPSSSSDSEPLVALLATGGLIVAIIGIIMSIIALMQRATMMTLRGRAHAGVGLALSSSAVILFCFVAAQYAES